MLVTIMGEMDSLRNRTTNTRDGSVKSYCRAHRSKTEFKPVSGRGTKGQAIVEFAVVVPLLLLMILGLLNLGILITSQIILTQASWEGARTGATLDPSIGEGDGEIMGSVRSSLSGLLHPETVTITIEPDELTRAGMDFPLPRGRPITVMAVYPVRLAFPFPLMVPLSANATSRIEYSNPP